MSTASGHHYHEDDSIEWRRDKVRELSSKSISIREIATILKIPKTTIHRDIQYLRQQAKDNISKYVEDILVREYDKCFVGVDSGTQGFDSSK